MISEGFFVGFKVGFSKDGTAVEINDGEYDGTTLIVREGMKLVGSTEGNFDIGIAVGEYEGL
jgi:hypothetical protein